MLLFSLLNIIYVITKLLFMNRKKVLNSIKAIAAICIISTCSIYSQTWYETAEQRIDTLRKGDFTLRITDTLGNPFTDSVNIRLKKHEFPWGNTIDFFDNSPLSKWKQAVLLKYYNYGVVEAFKWPYIEGIKGILNYSQVDFAYDWAEKVGWDLRAHTLLWGGDNSWQMPSWTLSMQGQELYNECETHIRREVNRYKGIIKEYDVINEPIHENWLAENAGDSINWKAFIWADEEDPDARLFLNEYNVIVWGTPGFGMAVQGLINHGAPIDGIGVQGHMEDGSRLDMVKERLDNVAGLGLPIKVTEFDMKIDQYGVNDQNMANYYAKMMRICFSHPAVEGFVWWGYCDPTYRDGSGIFSEDRSPKIAADTVYHLIHEKWSINIKTLPEVDGTVDFHGFYGDYEVHLKSGNENIFIPVSCLKTDDRQEIAINISDALPESPRLVQIGHSFDGTVLSLYFSKEMKDPSSHISDLLVYSDLSIDIDSASLDNENKKIVKLYLASDIKYGNYYSFSYIPGNWAATDSGLLEVIGAETINNKIPGCIGAQTTVEGDAIKVFLSEPVSDPSGSLADWQVRTSSGYAELSGISYKPGNDSVLVITLASPVAAGDNLRVYYNRGSLTSTSGYWLYDFSLKVENMVPLAIKNNINENLQVYPNPFKNEINLECNSSEYFDEILITDVLGRKVKYLINPNQNHIVINLNGLEKGIYILHLKKDGTIITNTKISKE
jgi:GH35 family endo-1,4-beta-xylanase